MTTQPKHARVLPGGSIIHTTKIVQAEVSQKTVEKLRSIGADPSAIAFAQRKVKSAHAH